MSNAFITQYFDWNRPDSRRMKLFNRMLRGLRYQARVTVPAQTGEMTSVEQRVNMYHLLESVLAFGVPGEVIEIGCHAGSSAALFQQVLVDHGDARRVHVYDGFFENTPAELLANFEACKLPPPTIHEGNFDLTLPAALPAKIAFVHIDIGIGDREGTMERLIKAALAAVYDRLSPGAVCLLADYYDPEMYQQPGYSFPNCIPFPSKLGHYPQVKRACDAFLTDKPDRMKVLYGGEYSHGFFRRSRS